MCMPLEDISLRFIGRYFIPVPQIEHRKGEMTDPQL